MDLNDLFSQKENCVDITEKLLVLLKVRVSFTTLREDLYNHPDYPSLLSVSDVLKKYGVENVSIKTGISQLTHVPMPCILPIRGRNNKKEEYTVIKTVNEETVVYFDLVKRDWSEITLKDFENKWRSGVVMLINAEEAQGEKDFDKNVRREKTAALAIYTGLLAFPVAALALSFWAFASSGFTAGLPVAYLSITLLGCIIAGLLIWHEIDQHNPVVQQICTAGKRVNCNAVLNSTASKIAGISWSTIGFTYFVGGLLTLFIIGLLNPLSLTVLAWLNTLAVPYVVFSIYYQWRVAKQWCLLCLSVQALLVLGFCVAFAGGWHSLREISSLFALNNVIAVTLLYVLPFTIVNLLLKAYKVAKENRENQAGLQRLKHNPQIFEALLARQKSIVHSTAELGILLGNPQARHKIIKVCNPYCGPCAKAHAPIEALLTNNPDVQVQIIFTATSKEEDKKALPVKHFLAIDEKGLNIANALDDWYLSESKDYENFAGKYPMNGELKKQDKKIRDMEDWCKKTEISFTPTFFVNGHQLPKIYSVADLKYFLSV